MERCVINVVLVEMRVMAVTTSLEIVHVTCVGEGTTVVKVCG